jgi:hypothetical protein
LFCLAFYFVYTTCSEYINPRVWPRRGQTTEVSFSPSHFCVLLRQPWSHSHFSLVCFCPTDQRPREPAAPPLVFSAFAPSVSFYLSRSRLPAPDAVAPTTSAAPAFANPVLRTRAHARTHARTHTLPFSCSARSRSRGNAAFDLCQQLNKPEFTWLGHPDPAPYTTAPPSSGIANHHHKQRSIPHSELSSDASTIPHIAPKPNIPPLYSIWD